MSWGRGQQRWGRGQQRCPHPGPWWQQLMLMWNFDFFFFFPPLFELRVLPSHISEDQTLTGLSALVPKPPPGMMRTLSPLWRCHQKNTGKFSKVQLRRPRGTLAPTIPTNVPPPGSRLLPGGAAVHEQPCTSRTLRPGGGKHAFMASRSGISYSAVQVIFKAGSPPPPTTP